LTKKVNLNEQFGRFNDHWSPKIVASVNDYDVKVVKVRGEFVWHQHEGTDEFFLVTDVSCASASKTRTTSSSDQANCS
jgi:hypothetical protein